MLRYACDVPSLCEDHVTKGTQVYFAHLRWLCPAANVGDYGEIAQHAGFACQWRGFRQSGPRPKNVGSQEWQGPAWYCKNFRGWGRGGRDPFAKGSFPHKTLQKSYCHQTTSQLNAFARKAFLIPPKNTPTKSISATAPYCSVALAPVLSSTALSSTPSAWAARRRGE